MNKRQYKLLLFVFFAFLANTIIGQPSGPPPPPDPDPVPIPGILALVIAGVYFGISKLRNRE